MAIPAFSPSRFLSMALILTGLTLVLSASATLGQDNLPSNGFRNPNRFGSGRCHGCRRGCDRIQQFAGRPFASAAASADGRWTVDDSHRRLLIHLSSVCV